jgi:hypothetical protein
VVAGLGIVAGVVAEAVAPMLAGALTVCAVRFEDPQAATVTAATTARAANLMVPLSTISGWILAAARSASIWTSWTNRARALAKLKT